MTQDAAAKRKAALRQQRAREADAEKVLRNPLVREALRRIEKTADSLWKESNAQDADQRDRAYYLYRALKDFEGHFISIVRTGKSAGKQLAELQKADRASKPKPKR